MNVDRLFPNNREAFTVFLKGSGYVLSFEVRQNNFEQRIVRSNYKFDPLRAALLTEREANEVMTDLKGAVIRPMAVVPVETPN